MRLLKAFWHWLVPVEHNHKAGDTILRGKDGDYISPVGKMGDYTGDKPKFYMNGKIIKPRRKWFK